MVLWKDKQNQQASDEIQEDKREKTEIIKLEMKEERLQLILEKYKEW